MNSSKTQTLELRSFWDVDSIEKAKHERVTVPAQPDAWCDEVQEAVNREIITQFPAPPARIIDYGCGVGRVARQFLRAGHEMIGIDVSPKMLEYAREYCEPYQATWVLTDGYSVPVESSSVHGAYSFYVFQHMSSWQMIGNVIGELHRCLIPGGVFILQTVDHFILTPDEVAPSFTGVRQPPERISAELSARGFSVVSTYVEKNPDHAYVRLKSVKLP